MKLWVGIGFALFVGLFLGVFGTFVCMSGPPPVAADCPGPRGTPCANGDVNADGNIDIGDGIYVLSYLFAKGPLPKVIECAACDSCCPPCPPSGLPATGQTLCYNANGAVIDCASTDFPGQDGFYHKGCPTADRFVDNQDGTVTDTCTGLMWQKETAPGTPTWQEALKYCEGLELAGHNDWRLPNVRELQSIVDYGRFSPSIDHVFGAESGWYWSSSTFVRAPEYACIVYFYSGVVDVGLGKDYHYKVRAVRG